MPNLITEKRKEQLQEMQKQLMDLNNSIQKIIDGETSMRQFAAELGMTSQTINNTINAGTYSLLYKARVLNSNDIKLLLKDSQSPAERLINVVLCNDDLVILDIAEEDKFIEIMKEALCERYYEIIKYRYGFTTGKPMTLEETGKHIGVTGSRIREIEAKALRRLRHPRYLKQLVPNYDLKIQELQETQAMIGHTKRLDNMIEENKNKLNAATSINIEDLTIDKLELSVRVYNCLQRSHILTVKDLKRCTVEDLKKIRNLGAYSLAEIISKLEQLGIVLKESEAN